MSWRRPALLLVGLNAGCVFAPGAASSERLQVQVLTRGEPSGVPLTLTAQRQAAHLAQALHLGSGFVLQQDTLIDLSAVADDQPLRLPPAGHLRIVPLGCTDDGRMRLDIRLEAEMLATTVTIARGATVAIGGLPVGQETLLVAVTYLP